MLKTANLAVQVSMSLLCCIFASCSNQAPAPAADIKTKEIVGVGEKEEHTCYAYISKQDTATMDIIRNGNKITGKLVYKLWEKDSNYGTVEGHVEGDYMFLYYTFQSEGITSVREEVFRMQEEGLRSGHGEIVMKADSARFANRNQLDFDTGLLFENTACN